jgi:hypothetical protein
MLPPPPKPSALVFISLRQRLVAFNFQRPLTPRSNQLSRCGRNDSALLFHDHPKPPSKIRVTQLQSNRESPQPPQPEYESNLDLLRITEKNKAKTKKILTKICEPC